MWIFLRSVIRGGLAGRGGCGPRGHKIKEHKSEGMRGTKRGGNCSCGHTSLGCFILQLRGSSISMVWHRSLRMIADSKHTGSRRGRVTTDDLGCGSLCSDCRLSLICNLSWQLIRRTQWCLSSVVVLSVGSTNYHLGFFHMTKMSTEKGQCVSPPLIPDFSPFKLSLHSFMLWALKK